LFAAAAILSRFDARDEPLMLAAPPLLPPFISVMRQMPYYAMLRHASL